MGRHLTSLRDSPYSNNFFTIIIAGYYFYSGIISIVHTYTQFFFITDVGNFQLVMSHKFWPNLTSFVSYDVS